MKKDSILKIYMGNITIKVVMQGFWHGEGRPESLMHNHTAFEFHMMMRGSALLETDQKSIELTQKDSVLIPPKAFHSFKNKENGSAIISFTFFVEKNKSNDGSNYEDLIEQRLKSANEPIVFSQNLQIEEFFTKIVAGLYSQSLVAQERTKAWFTLLFAEMFSLFEDKENKVYDYGSDFGENDSGIFMIGEYFNEYYMEDISLKNLSERLYLSTKQTDKMIKKAFGEGFRQHLCKIRLLIAKKLLRDTDMEVREIADSVGYKSYNGFYLAFKQNVNMTPQQYREKQRKDGLINHKT